MVDLKWMLLLVLLCFIREVVISLQVTQDPRKQIYEEIVDLLVKEWNQGIRLGISEEARLNGLKDTIEKLIKKYESL